METVKVSPKYEVVIPREVRRRMRIRPGERMQVIAFDNRIQLVRVRPAHEMRGFLEGLDPTFRREKEDRV